MLLFTLLIAIASFFRGKGQQVLLPPQSVTLGFLLLLYAYTVGSALLLQKTAVPVRTFGLVQLLSDTVGAALLVYATGCSSSVFAPIFLLPVIAAGLILHRSGGLVLAAAATLLYGAVLGSELLHWLPAYYRAPAYRAPDNLFISTNLFATYGLIFFLAALLSGQLARRLRSTEERLNRTALEFDRLSILYKQIFDDIATGIITTDSRNRITSCNRAAERITGCSRMLLLGQPFSGRFPAISLREERQGRSVCDFRKRDGTAIRLGYSYSNLNMPAEQGQEQENGWKVITLQDISQIERMERQIRETEKLAAIGQMSGSVAHGFRNPLAAISGSAQILALDQDNLAAIDAATFRTLVGIILRESGRMAKTITDFLQFARPAAVQPEWFSLGRLVDEVVSGLLQGPLGAASPYRPGVRRQPRLLGGPPAAADGARPSARKRLCGGGCRGGGVTRGRRRDTAGRPGGAADRGPRSGAGDCARPEGEGIRAVLFQPGRRHRPRPVHRPPDHRQPPRHGRHRGQHPGRVHRPADPAAATAIYSLTISTRAPRPRSFPAMFS